MFAMVKCASVAVKNELTVAVRQASAYQIFDDRVGP
jgi:hypothetical protein